MDLEKDHTQSCVVSNVLWKMCWKYATMQLTQVSTLVHFCKNQSIYYTTIAKANITFLKKNSLLCIASISYLNVTLSWYMT